MKRRFRKRRGQRNPSSSTFSEALSVVNLHIGGRDTPAALGALEALFDQPLDAGQKAKILALAADCRFFEQDQVQARDVYQRALELALEEPDSRFWLRPCIGKLTALVTLAQIDAAHLFAEEILAITDRVNTEYDALLNTPMDQLADGGLVIPPRPHRKTVVLTRIGRAFETRGYAVDAARYYLQSVEMAPRGAARARQALAAIALANGDHESAARLATESLRLGQFKVKTIPSWEVMIAARSKAGQSHPVPPALLDKFFSTSLPASVRGRTVLVIARALRDHDHVDWFSVVSAWRDDLKQIEPVIRAELVKLRLADATFHHAPAEQRERLAARLLRMPQTSVSEHIAAAKAWLSAVLDSNPDTDPEFAPLFRVVEDRFPAKVHFRLLHSLARTALDKNHPLLARRLFARNAASGGDDPYRQRSLWCLARLDQRDGRHEQAARGYLRIAQLPVVDSFLRIQALLLALEQLQLTRPSEESVASLISRLETLLAQLTDATTLLDVARQLTLAGSSFAGLAQSTIARATGAALDEIDQANTPAAATRILCHLARRQYYEFNQHREIVAFWDTLPETKREWLWSHADFWWEYLSIVFLALHTVGRGDHADGLARTRLESAATPPNGIAWLGATRLHWLARSHDMEGCVATARIVAAGAASHRQTAYAHYWLALAESAAGNTEPAVRHAVAVRHLVRSGGTARLRGLALRAALLLERMEHPVPLDTNLPRTEEQRHINTQMLDRDLRIAGKNT